jgi:hypothetical protein
MSFKAVTACAFAAGIAFVTSMAHADSPEWTKTLKSMGKVYTGDETSTIQSVKLFGRIHGQWNYSDGESVGQDFNGSGEELRRLRFGGSVEFLNGFKVLGRMNLEEGGFGRTELDFDSWDELYVSYGRDDWSVGYGRYKLLFGGEEHQSSKRIKTIERSAINNRFGSRRPTGFKVTTEKGGVEYILGVWSREPEQKDWAGWDGTAVQGSATFEAMKGEWILDFVYADDADSNNTVFNYDWASSVTYNRDFSWGGLMTNLTFSEANEVDPLGIVILPTYDIKPGKLEAAFRYQWANSSATDTGVPRSSSSRGIRRVASKEGLQSGSGEDYHALYGGLNYYIAGDNVKLMTGLEYETIRGNSARELDGLTFWLAARVYF